MIENRISIDPYAPYEFFDKKIVKEDVIFVNDLNYDDEADRQILKKSLFVTLSSPIIDIVPSCMCGAVKATYLKGATCDRCQTEVSERFGDFKPFVWVKQIKGCKPFIAPWFIATIDTLAGKSNNRSLLRWFGDTSYNPPLPLSQNSATSEESLYDLFRAMPGFNRSYTFFVDNLEDILLCFLRYKNHTKEKSRRIQYVIELFRNESRSIFTDVLPILHRDLIVEEKTSKGAYVKVSRMQVINTTESFMRYCNSENVTYRDRATAIITQSISDMMVGVTKDFVSGKLGLVRKQLMGARLHFSFRQVLTSIGGTHEYDECHMSWRSSIVVFRPHIINKLYKRGLTYKEVNRMLKRALTIFDPYIYDILNELIRESPGGIPVWMHRNPSQDSASILLLRITFVKTDPNDTSVSLSSIIFTYPNADVDGDELNYHLILDNKMTKMLECLKPHRDVLDASNAPLAIFGKVGLPETCNATLTNMIQEGVIKHGLKRKV